MSVDLDGVVLMSGGHSTRTAGVCLLEAVAWVAGEEHTDHPICVCPVLGAYGRALNDVLPDAKRQQLRPFVPRMVGTAGDGHAETRAWMAMDWLLRTWLPAWLDLAGLDDHAREVRQTPEVVDLDTLAAGAAAGAAARDAAWAAARAAARAKLQPTVEQLQQSAIDLMEKMISLKGSGI